MHLKDETINDYIDDALTPAERASVEQHLAGCGDCALVAAELKQIVRETRALAPLQPAERVWRSVAAQFADDVAAAKTNVVRLEERRKTPFAIWSWRPAWAIVTAAMVVLAFIAGRWIEQRHQRPVVTENRRAQAIAPADASASAQVRERVLLVAVGDHLERSQLVLVELANAHTNDELDISAERQSADELVASNRLYRQTAAEMGQTSLADVLDDLERVLVEVARGPSQVSVRQLADIQQRIEAQGILFKVKVIGSEMRDRENSINTGRRQPVS
jgi:putative zinc finger protein